MPTPEGSSVESVTSAPVVCSVAYDRPPPTPAILCWARMASRRLRIDRSTQLSQRRLSSTEARPVAHRWNDGLLIRSDSELMVRYNASSFLITEIGRAH